MKIGYTITGRGGERSKFHLMKKGSFLCNKNAPKNNLITVTASLGDVECKKCLKKV